MMTREADYLPRVLVQSPKDYVRFVRQQIHNIEGIAWIDTSFAYGTVKKTTEFPPCKGVVRHDPYGHAGMDYPTFPSCGEIDADC
ncbi:transcriptional regulator BkdR [Rhizobium grahamii]|uniref:Transcriptional regulator BkdR n=1 Tax=Rhizobium grahamii TaxID=1120045 RepID=A0A370KIQ2_9HYPH|nr:transcriptional regulator BkdR [Rhizobium grahamii]